MMMKRSGGCGRCGWVGCVSECVVVTTTLRHKDVSLNGSSREKRMEGYKFSTNWLHLETQKPDVDRQSTPQAGRVRGCPLTFSHLWF